MDPRKLVSALALAGCALFATAAHALDARAGIANAPYISSGGNFDYRVTLQGVSTMCTGGGAFAYTNYTDLMFSTFRSVLIAAWLAGKNVTLYTQLVSGQCHIVEIQVS